MNYLKRSHNLEIRESFLPYSIISLLDLREQNKVELKTTLNDIFGTNIGLLILDDILDLLQDLGFITCITEGNSEIIRLSKKGKKLFDSFNIESLNLVSILNFTK